MSSSSSASCRWTRRTSHGLPARSIDSFRALAALRCPPPASKKRRSTFFRTAPIASRRRRLMCWAHRPTLDQFFRRTNRRSRRFRHYRSNRPPWVPRENRDRIYTTPYLTRDFLAFGALYGLYLAGRIFLTFFVACRTLALFDLGRLSLASAGESVDRAKPVIRRKALR